MGLLTFIARQIAGCDFSPIVNIVSGYRTIMSSAHRAALETHADRLRAQGERVKIEFDAMSDEYWLMVKK